jgi:iron(III) transport system permease protein
MDETPPFALAWRLLACAAVTALLIAVFGAGAYQRQLYLRTGQLAAATAVISLPISTVLAVAIFRARFPGRRLLQVVLLAQLFFPLYLQAAAWEAGFGRIGWYSIRSGDLDSPWLSGMWGAVWTHAAASVPWATLLLGIGLAAGNRDMEEAALLDEPPRWVLLRVVLPRLIPWWMIAAAWIGISTATDMTAADLYLVDTYPRVIYTGFAFQATLARLTWQVSTAILWVVQLALSALLLAHQLLPAGRVPLAWNARGLPDLMARPVAAAIAWSWCGTMAMLPWANLVYQAGRGQVLPGQYQWTSSRFAEVMTQGAREFQGEIAWSLVIGSLATLCVVPLAGVLAWWARRSRVAAGVFALLLAGLAAFPAPLLGLWLLAACTPWNQAWIVWLTDQTVFLPILAVLLRQLPWAVLIAWFALRQIPKEQFESADLEGVPGWRQAIRIAAAQLPAAWLAIALVSLALSVGELSATLMVTPPAVSTVATRMFGLIHAGVRDKEAALALWNIAGCLLLSGCLILLLPRLANNPGAQRRQGRRTEVY